MKKQGVRWAVTVCLALFLATGTAQAQEGQGKYITEATIRLSKMVDAANRDGFMLSTNLFSIGGGWLKQDAANWVPLFTVQLDAGKDYRFLASGDADTKDLDLKITDANGAVVKADEGAEPEAIVNYRPTQTGRYLVSLRLYDSVNNQPCTCLGVVTMKK